MSRGRLDVVLSASRGAQTWPGLADAYPAALEGIVFTSASQIHLRVVILYSFHFNWLHVRKIRLFDFLAEIPYGQIICVSNSLSFLWKSFLSEA